MHSKQVWSLNHDITTSLSVTAVTAVTAVVVVVSVAFTVTVAAAVAVAFFAATVAHRCSRFHRRRCAEASMAASSGRH